MQICQKGQRPQGTKADESTCTKVKVVHRLHQNNQPIEVRKGVEACQQGDQNKSTKFKTLQSLNIKAIKSFKRFYHVRSQCP